MCGMVGVIVWITFDPIAPLPAQVEGPSAGVQIYKYNFAISMMYEKLRDMKLLPNYIHIL